MSCSVPDKASGGGMLVLEGADADDVEGGGVANCTDGPPTDASSSL